MSLKPSAQRVQDLLADISPDLQVVEMPDSTRTSEEAAAACGCTVAQIGKSLLFRVKATGQPILVVASGSNRVDEKKLAKLVGSKIGRADADFVREKTGFAIGGVPPLGHAQPPLTYLDKDLQQFESIWCAAGTPNAVFELTPALLQQITGANYYDIRK